MYSFMQSGHFCTVQTFFTQSKPVCTVWTFFAQSKPVISQSGLLFAQSIPFCHIQIFFQPIQTFYYLVWTIIYIVWTILVIKPYVKQHQKPLYVVRGSFTTTKVIFIQSMIQSLYKMVWGEQFHSDAYVIKKGPFCLKVLFIVQSVP